LTPNDALAWSSNDMGGGPHVVARIASPYANIGEAELSPLYDTMGDGTRLVRAFRSPCL